MIFGHIPAAGVVGRLVFKRFYGPLVLFALAFLPDLFDKNLYLVFHIFSRGYFHSLAAVAGVFLIVSALSRLFPKRIGQTLAMEISVLYLLHIACDVVGFKILFWPFDFSSRFPAFKPIALFAGEFNISQIMDRFYLKVEYPLWLGCEIAFLAVYLGLLANARRKGEPTGFECRIGSSWFGPFARRRMVLRSLRPPEDAEANNRIDP